MTRWAGPRALLRALLVLGLLAARAAAAEPPEAVAPASGPVVLELFTSQGCSSCPPAEELLSRLGLDEQTRALVVPLAFHVDYWNRIGWTDPFSVPAWSLRQEAYRRALNVEGGNYTPQLVIDGQAQLPGSQAQRALGAISAALQRPSRARVRLEARAREDGHPEWTGAVTAEVLEDVAARRLEVLVALFENGLVTAVARGENAGRTLRNDFIVRRLETALAIESRKGASQRRELRLKLAREWKPQNLGLAAFLQDPASMRIYAAVVLPLVAHPAASGTAAAEGR